MPKYDMWPAGVAMESLSSGDSAGSCDSVISMNSTCSEDSMEHLSAEERACLMYLEEAIGALEVHQDSGLSNDEPESRIPADRTANDISSFVSGPQSSIVSAANGHDANSASLDLVSRLTRPLSKSDTGSKGASSASQTKILNVAKDGDGKPKIVTCDKISRGQSTEASEVDLGLIPPPSDFMDEPDSPGEPQKIDFHPSVGTSTNKPADVTDLDLIVQRASVKRTSLSSPVTKDSVNQPPPEGPLSLSQPPAQSGAQTGPVPEAAEPKNRPVVAPKPKKLPANIILKSQLVSAPSEGNGGHSGPSSGDRALLDPQRVRIEALRKLGLLKSEEADLGPSLSPKQSPKAKLWSAPPPEVNPVIPHTPPLTPSSVHVSSPTPASVALQSPAAVLPSGHSAAPPAQLLPEILPAPAAFCDPDSSPSPGNDVSEAEVNTPPLTPPALAKQLTPPKITGIKSATLERSGPGLGSGSGEFSHGVRGDEDPTQPGHGRLRPSSLRSRKEGEPGSQRPPFAHTTGDSQKLPRSQGISVLICPRAENGEDRRNALRKLGLLRD